jgi:hypothetical protein
MVAVRDLEKKRATTRKWHHEHKEERKQWRAKRKIEERTNKLRQRHGLTLADYESMWTIQNGGCAICSEPLKVGPGESAVDHDHSTGEVRGLLCRECNTGLGKFKDSNTLLQLAQNYLSEPPARLLRRVT